MAHGTKEDDEQSEDPGAMRRSSQVREHVPRVIEKVGSNLKGQRK